MRSLKPLCLLKRRYRIISQVGEGGFGTVYHAEDTLLGLPVALKALKGDDHAIVQLRQEARYLASLKHTGIPSFHDFFQERGRWHLVMEWIDGAHICVGHPLTVKQVIWVGRQVCPILYYLHTLCQQPVIHRDIKPANLRISRTQQLYLVDFGISCPPGVNERALGSPGYAAPEQWQCGGQITPKADIYSLGETLRELLTGRSPAKQASTTQKLRSQTKSTQMQKAKGSGYYELTDLLTRMTAQAPEKRPDAREVWQELDALRHSLSGEAHATQ
jgi:serine/threonine protein kinase